LTFLASLALTRSAAQDLVISAEQNYAASSPGVVMVQTVYTGIVYVNKVEMNERNVRVARMTLTRSGTADGKRGGDIRALKFYPRNRRPVGAVPGLASEEKSVVKTGVGRACRLSSCRPSDMPCRADSRSALLPESIFHPSEAGP